MDQLKKIRNELFVSDRIVTYKTAAAILQVNVNEAKTILDTFVTDIKGKGELLCVTYVVGGITSENQHKIALVADSKYDKAKALFRTVTVDHIYSLQKSPQLEWAAIANVDDFMRADKIVEPTSKIEKPATTAKLNETASRNNSKSTQPVKKGSLSNFFTQSASAKDQNKLPNNKDQSNKTGVKKEAESKNGKPGLLASFMAKNNCNKENNSKTSNAIKATVMTACAAVKAEDEDVLVEDSDNEDFVVKKNKKRTRVLHDDDEDDDTPTNKLAKVDILDDHDEEEMQQEMSSEDIFGSPERDEESCDVEESAPSDVADKDSESTEPSEPVDITYEDSDGYFVTERNPASKKQITKVPAQLEERIKEVEKKEKAVKKEIAQKIKSNTNQKTLLNFFTKK